MRMEKITKACPKCGSEKEKIKRGLNRSGTQRIMCTECGIRFTLAPKKREHSEETRTLALKIYYAGASGRGVGKVLGFSKANVYNWIKKNGSDCG